MAHAVSQWVSRATSFAGQSAQQIRTALQHIQHGARCEYHGPYCVWCQAAHRIQQPPSAGTQAARLHPEPAALRSSGRALEGARHGLVVDALNHPRIRAHLHQWKRGFTAKYGVEYDVELSGTHTLLTEENLASAVAWLVREPQRASFVTLFCADDVPEAALWERLMRHTFAHVVWVILDRARTRPLGLAYQYAVGAGGPSVACVRPTTAPAAGTVIALHHAETGAALPAHAWQHAIYQVTVDAQGHRSLADLLVWLERLLAPLGASVRMECNRLLDMDNSYFAFSVLEPALTPAADPSPAPPCSPPPPTTRPRTPDGCPASSRTAAAAPPPARSQTPTHPPPGA